jgi:hypothetical protein
MMKRGAGILFFLALLGGCPASGQDLTIRTYVDRNVVGLNEQFTLSIELTGKGANSASDPEIPQIGQFASYLGSGSSQNIQFTNGKMAVTKVINCYFVASAVGKYKIPPVQVTYNGKAFASAAIDMEVQQSGTKPPAQQQAAPQQPAPAQQGTGPAEGDLFVRATVDRRQVFQNEPVIVTYKIYTRVNVSNVGISKMPATAGFWTEEFEIPQQLQTSSEVLDGKKYTVATVRKMALFPMSPGAKTIDPMVLDCEVTVRASRSRDPFGDFFDDSFFFGGRAVRKQIQSKPVTIEVLPFPEEGKPANFTGITGRFRVSASADKRSVKTNEAITYKIYIEGEGNIRQIQAPEIAFPTDFEVYPPKVTETLSRSGAGISGRKTFEYVLIPRAEGEETLKPVALSFFDPASKSYKTVRTESIALQVAQGAEGYTTVAGSGLSKEEVRLIGQDIRFIKTADTPFRRTGMPTVPPAFYWSVFLLPLLGLAGAFAYRKHLDRISGDVAYARGIRASSAVRKRLSAAKSLIKGDVQKQFYAEAGRALQGYIGDKLNIAEAGMISGEVEAILRRKGVSEETARGFFDCLDTCDMKRFSPESATVEEMKAFFHKVETAIMKLEKEL